MNKKLFSLLLSLCFCCLFVSAQEVKKSDLQVRAEAADKEGTIATARYLYIRAFEDYANKGQMQLGVECATKATALYYKENYWKEAFDLLHRADQAISAEKKTGGDALHYQVTKERLKMYMKLRKSDSAKDQISVMESQAKASGDENLQNDLLYNKAIYHYTFSSDFWAKCTG